MLTKEQIEFLNTRCNTITISKVTPQFKAHGNSINARNQKDIDTILSHLSDKSKITKIIFSSGEEISYDILKSFPNIQSISSYTENLSLEIISKLINTCENILELYFNTID